eukprot:GHVL01031907.1.p1 GENE.GHVL01031907.1~~GHVL01031907.1.p1  ORF type:complete len:416 (+),score=82.90 GHVL01031907.1:22-1248(+)
MYRFGNLSNEQTEEVIKKARIHWKENQNMYIYIVRNQGPMFTKQIHDTCIPKESYLKKLTGSDKTVTTVTNLKKRNCILDHIQSFVTDYKKYETVDFQLHFEYNRQPIGLVNRKNMCYMNSVLQMLFSCGAFANLLKKVDTDMTKKTYTVMKQLLQMMETENKPVNALGILEPALCNWITDDMQDSEEFLTWLLGQLNDESKWTKEIETGPNSEIKKKFIVEDSPIIRIFGGSMINQSKSSNEISHFFVYHLYLEKDQNFEMDEVISNQTKKQKIEGMEEEREELFVELPQVFVLSVKNMCYNKEKQRVEKTNGRINFPENFKTKGCWHSRNEEHNYELIGVVVHHGSTCSSGHFKYTCRSKDNKWIELNDAYCRDKELIEVLALEPFMLVYEKKGCPSIDLIKNRYI